MLISEDAAQPVGRDLNPGVFSAISAKLQAIAVEMGFTLKRTSRSLYVKDGEDFCAAVVGLDGLILAAPDTVGSTLLTLVNSSAAIEAVGTLAPGDVLITNDAFTSGALSTHLADIHVIEPYYGDELVGYGWAFIHSSDMGGRVPSSISPLNTSVYQEGLQIPPGEAREGGRHRYGDRGLHPGELADAGCQLGGHPRDSARQERGRRSHRQIRDRRLPDDPAAHSRPLGQAVPPDREKPAGRFLQFQ
jgi:hypothetical protein